MNQSAPHPWNEDQLQAMQHRDGPMLVVAGPGSGKTTVLTHRIRYLTGECGMDPGKILVITFTRAAAREMEERYRKLVQDDFSGPERVTFGTFHSVFYQILREYDRRPLRLIEGGEDIRILREVLKQHFPETAFTPDYLELLLSGFSKLKNGLPYENTAVSKDDMRHQKPGPGKREAEGPAFRMRLFARYQETLHRRGLIDFDDMLLLALELLEKDEAVLQRLRERYHYIMVDEFQDINPVQFEIVQLLAAPRNNLFVVGDDDQSIYAFRGSDPRIMLSFPEHYPDTRMVELGENYRSTDNIVRSAKRLIGHNKNRFQKSLRTSKDAGPQIEICECKNEAEEAAAVVKALGRIPAGKTVGVLVRTHRAGQLVERLLADHAITADVRLMTFHASKGLEFDIVYLIEANEDVTSGKSGIKNDGFLSGASGLFDSIFGKSGSTGGGSCSRWSTSGGSCGKDSRDNTDRGTGHAGGASRGGGREPYLRKYLEYPARQHRERLKARAALEEERRMFYVAMTRARTELHIFYTKRHYNKKRKRSQFLREL